jgi:hypothetical protein
LLGWLLLLSFTVWKHGSVRSGREAFFLGFITVLAFVLEAVPCERRAARWWARGLALGICGVSLITLQQFCFAGWPRSLGYRLTIRPESGWLLNPAEYQRQMAGGSRRTGAAQLLRYRERPGARAWACSATPGHACHTELSPAPGLSKRAQSAVDAERAVLSLEGRPSMLFQLRVDQKFPPMKTARCCGRCWQIISP